MKKEKRRLRVLAGPGAVRRLRKHGLEPEHVGAVFGASGAAKWLAICGLDQSIFGQWLSETKHEILLYGTSVGAFKLAAACRKDPEASLQALADTYIRQSYTDGAGSDDIERETERMLDVIFADGGVEEILRHPFLRYSCGTALTKGMMASHSRLLQYLAVARAMATNILGRNVHRGIMERVVFADARSHFPLKSVDAYGDTQIALNENNLRMAVKASGSIPIMMHSVKNVPGGPRGEYVDGGLVDYHPAPGWFWDSQDLILYPHFYAHLQSGWFDKYYKNRKARGNLLDNVILLAPSEFHLSTLKLGRIPDRRDFKTMHGDDELRMALWQDAVDQSRFLGEEFMQIVRSGDIAASLEEIY